MFQNLPANGRLRFDRFMELALYDEHHGYYSSNLSALGPRGDFATSATLSDSLALAIAGWIRTHQPRHVIEIGPGTGQLARAILTHFDSFGLARRLGVPLPRRPPFAYHLVERSPILAAAQRKLLRRAVRWHPTVQDALLSTGGEASLFSNELVDAFPVRVFRKANPWDELFLSLADRQLTETFPPAESLPDSTHFGHQWPEGQRIEVHQSYQHWLAEWLPGWKTGQLLTIDYGGSSPGLYHRAPAGSLRAYYHHQRHTGPDLYSLPGRKDLTADVNFDDLVRWGEELGLTTLSHTNQRDFLLPHLHRDPNTHSEADRFLTNPHGAGSAFQILLQQR